MANYCYINVLAGHSCKQGDGRSETLFTGSKAGEAGAYLASWRLQFGRCIVENFRGQNTKYNNQGDLLRGHNSIQTTLRLPSDNLKTKKGMAFDFRAIQGSCLMRNDYES